MPKVPLIYSTLFIALHIAIVAPFVPLANILPAGFGAVSMSSMALTLIIAARWRLIDDVMGGPDKSYVVHRWLGFLALVGALLHWALASSVGAGVLPVLAESGEDVGVFAALGLLTLTAAALVRAIPYHLWKASHTLMGPIFVLAAFHTFLVASPLAVGAAPWTLMAIVSVIGLIAWGQTLRRKLSPTRLVEVASVKRFEGGVDVTFRSEKDLAPFQLGQYATLAGNHARAEAHPFTIAGGDERSRRFVIRSAGDWTDAFVTNVKAGDTYRISGGFGRFLPRIDAKRLPQIWVAGGVGITPYLAALVQMTPDSGESITLVYCMKSRGSAGGIEDAERHAARLPQVSLVVFSEEEAGRMTQSHFAKIVQSTPYNTEVFLCGPEGLKTLVTNCWEDAGMSGKIHSERFNFRGAYSVSDLIYIGRPMLSTAQTMIERARTSKYAPAGS
ncbi:MAG: ferric reductase-like transmembrane domain-containing protein [Pseudomonadota bacterium]